MFKTLSRLVIKITHLLNIIALFYYSLITSKTGVTASLAVGHMSSYRGKATSISRYAYE
jgi:hypothetical protein